MRRSSLLLLLLLAPLACSQGEAGGSEAALAKRGEQVFQTNCTACHARDPRRDGPVGPPVAGASLELLEAKVLRNEYPPGYTPKRDTKAMIPLVHLEPELPALAAYLEAEAHE
jgi:mono/diheme cytochrome c family protein